MHPYLLVLNASLHSLIGLLTRPNDLVLRLLKLRRCLRTSAVVTVPLLRMVPMTEVVAVARLTAEVAVVYYPDVLNDELSALCAISHVISA